MSASVSEASSTTQANRSLFAHDAIPVLWLREQQQHLHPCAPRYWLLASQETGAPGTGIHPKQGAARIAYRQSRPGRGRLAIGTVRTTKRVCCGDAVGRLNVHVGCSFGKLLRWLNAARPWRQTRWVLFGLLVAGSFVLGYAGFAVYFERDSRSITDLLYLSMQLFVLESGSVPTAGAPWQLEVARWLAPATTATALLAGLMIVLREEIASLRLRFRKNHTVICGLGEKGSRLAEALLDDGWDVVGIEIDPSSPMDQRPPPTGRPDPGRRCPPRERLISGQGCRGVPCRFAARYRRRQRRDGGSGRRAGRHPLPGADGAGPYRELRPMHHAAI